MVNDHSGELPSKADVVASLICSRDTIKVLQNHVAELSRQLVDQRAEIKRLTKQTEDDFNEKALVEALRVTQTALDGLIKCNEAWNTSVETIIGRPAGWNDFYLNDAREALKQSNAALAAVERVKR